MGETTAKTWYELLLGYLTQETTYIGFFAMLGAFKVKLSATLQAKITTFCIAMFDLILAIIAEVKANKVAKIEEKK